MTAACVYNTRCVSVCVYRLHVGLKFPGHSGKKKLIEDARQVGRPLPSYALCVCVLLLCTEEEEEPEFFFLVFCFAPWRKEIKSTFWRCRFEIPAGATRHTFFRMGGRKWARGAERRAEGTIMKRRKSRSVNGWSRFVNSAGIYRTDDGQYLFSFSSFIFYLFPSSSSTFVLGWHTHALFDDIKTKTE